MLWALADLSLTTGNIKMAKHMAKSSLAIYDDLQSRVGQALTRMLLAAIAQYEGDVVMADRFVRPLKRLL